MTYIDDLRWTVLFQDDFFAEFEGFSTEVRSELAAMAVHIAEFGEKVEDVTGGLLELTLSEGIER